MKESEDGERNWNSKRSPPCVIKELYEMTRTERARGEVNYAVELRITGWVLTISNKIYSLQRSALCELIVGN